MNRNNKLDVLGRAFVYGELDELAELLTDECSYRSDKLNKKITSSEQILHHIRMEYGGVINSIRKKTPYRYEIVELTNILQHGVTIDNLRGESIFEVYQNGLLLYRNDAVEPVAVVFITDTSDGKIAEIELSRNEEWFDLVFYGKDSKKDIPYTVKAMRRCDNGSYEVKMDCNEKTEYQKLDDSEVYIWRQSDKFVKRWLSDNGYRFMESQVFDDCIGYRCNRNGHAYTIFMFAYGKEKKPSLDGEYCKKLTDYPLSEQSTVLVIYLNVKRWNSNQETKYLMSDCYGNGGEPPEVWRVKNVEGKWILEYYRHEEMYHAMDKLMYAFNRECMDGYDCVISDDYPVSIDVNFPIRFMTDDFYQNMLQIHQEYGDMKIGYACFNDTIYTAVLYIDGFGYFNFTLDYRTNKIVGMSVKDFDESDYKEFIKSEEREKENRYSNIPTAINVSVLSPVHTERFAFKISFDNGECRKYILPIDREVELDDIVSYKGYDFTDEIWNSARMVESSDSHRGMAIAFSNEFRISVLKCYEEGELYSEPEICNDVILEDDEKKIIRLWKWNVNVIYKDGETGLVGTLLTGDSFTHGGISTLATCEGKRICSINFNYLESFHEGFSLVGKRGYGYGFIDKDMNFITSMMYDDAEEIEDGKFEVWREKKCFFVDGSGKEIPAIPENANLKYQDVGQFREGMCKVSTLKLDFMDLAYHSDDSAIAGIWGFVNEDGVEVIAPQYIYADDFRGDIAIVCKGKWTIDKKWDNEHNSGKYWTDEELWGGIDKEGNVAIPFIFDEMKRFWDIDGTSRDDVFVAHYGNNWEEGNWGIIDNRGNWITDHTFEDIDNTEFYGDMFVFCKEDEETGDYLYGIYDMKQNKVIFKPKFQYASFDEDGWIYVREFDEELGYEVERIIDREGNEKFHSIYTSISRYGELHEVEIRDMCSELYEVTIDDENGERNGLIDGDGTVILPCENKIVFHEIDCERKLFVFEDGDKQGMKDFDGNVIVEPIYDTICRVKNPLITVRIGKKNYHGRSNCKEGLMSKDGTLVLPVEYKDICCYQDNYITACRDGYCEMLYYIEK